MSFPRHPWPTVSAASRFLLRCQISSVQLLCLVAESDGQVRVKTVGEKERQQSGGSQVLVAKFAVFNNSFVFIFIFSRFFMKTKKKIGEGDESSSPQGPLELQTVPDRYGSR